MIRVFRSINIIFCRCGLMEPPAFIAYHRKHYGRSDFHNTQSRPDPLHPLGPNMDDWHTGHDNYQHYSITWPGGKVKL